ncbi:hypothetical protein CGMCC3_g9671 [Colletotrichum fructicola]|nr:uncharacterized protein CGMCC3_g9671 [Colletotrichum fructicola]KAE9574240.1 hypothetical protein CGMCC3_g9671 [Colletotrichum fructicola]
MAENKYLEVDKDSLPYVFMKNVDLPLRTYQKGFLRCNVYLPKDAAPFGPERYPVIATYGPYGKDVPYSVFHKKSWNQLNPEMKSHHASWETPDPGFWTGKGYIVVRADELGAGQSPGLLDTMSRGTSEAFFDVVEWCSEQEWSSGKVGLLGISYYAGTQWRVAARKPKGLAAMVPWEGMSDYYRDRVRHGGILSDKFIKFWWENGVSPNQYGKPGRAARNWGDDTVDGDLDEHTLRQNRRDQTVDTAAHRFRDEEYYRTRDFDVEAIETPLLSVANWDNDADGWKTGGQPRVQLCLRQGEAGVDDPERERKFPKRHENDWPLPGTQYQRFFLAADEKLAIHPSETTTSVSYDAMNGDPISFRYKTPAPLEITGHIVTHLTVSASRKTARDSPPTDIDLFVTLRKINVNGQEVFYTGTMGDPVPIVKGWLRVSQRLVDTSHHFHRDFMPHRNYHSTDVQPVKENEKYAVDVEVWPTNVVLEPGETLVLEIAGHDTQGVGSFSHGHAKDRDEKTFTGINTVHTGGDNSWLLLPVINSER